MNRHLPSLLAIVLCSALQNAQASDVTVQPAVGSGFVIKDASGTNERLRVQETGAVSLPGITAAAAQTQALCTSASGVLGPCSADVSGGSSSYGAGVGLTLSGYTFSVAPTYRLPQTCSVNQVAQWSGASWTCAAGGSSYSASTGLTLTSSAFAVAPTYQLPQTCTANQVPQWSGSGWVCAATSTNYTASTGLTLSGGAFSVAPPFQLPQTCAANQVPQWSGTAWTCATMSSGTTVPAGTMNQTLRYDAGNVLTTNSQLQAFADGGLLASGTFGTGNIPATGSGTRMVWYPAKAAFRMGSVDGAQWDDSNVGPYSTAAGFDVIASGLGSTAFGWTTQASGTESVAMGYQSLASGPGSIALGGGAKSTNLTSIAMGNNTTAAGRYSTAMGIQSAANGETSTAMGAATVANGDNSVAMGNGSQANGDAATAMGFGTIANQPYSTTMGYKTNTQGVAATAMGNSTTASGIDSTAMGNSTYARGPQSTAMGLSTAASGTASTAMGNNTTADGNYSTAMGRNVTNGHWNGSFIWGDSFLRAAPGVVSNSAHNQFMVVASGGVNFYTDPNAIVGAGLASGSSAWTTISDRNAKTAVRPVNGRDVLDKVVAIPLNTWQYKTQESKYRHMGPMAQDFYAAFHLGESDKGIDTVDADGVALAAIQGLNALLAEKDETITARLNEKDREIAALRADKDREIAALRAELVTQNAHIASLRSLAADLAEVKAQLAALQKTTPSVLTVAQHP